jgi:hypothetical protein
MRLSEYPIEYIEEQKVEFNKLVASDDYTKKSHRAFAVDSGIRCAMTDRELEKNYLRWLEKRNIIAKVLERISFAMELRKRGYEVDIETQDNKDYFEGAKESIEEFMRKLSDFKYITDYIKSKGKYMSDEEKKRWIG